MTTPRRSRRPAPQARGNSSSLIAIGALLVIVGAVFVIFLMMDKQQKPAGGSATEAVDPFADVPDELPPNRRPAATGSTDSTDDPFGGVADPFADVEIPEENPIWLNSLSGANRALGLIEEAVAARAAGDRTTASTKGAEAQKLLETSLEATREWAIDLEKRLGPENLFVRKVNKRTARWRRELMALRKTAGL